MILGMYSVRDIKSGWLTPSIDQNDATAARNFEHAIQQKNSLLFTHARDYDLFKIANFDSDTGEIIACDPQLVLEGAFVRGAIDV